MKEIVSMVVGAKPGDLVVALRDGTRDPKGFPLQVPQKGHIYRVLLLYKMDYGIGCELEGLDADPYYGYFMERRVKGKVQPWFIKLSDLTGDIAKLGEL